jgi:DNA invertase Pin-like site-specific DNA recombinase
MPFKSAWTPGRIQDLRRFLSLGMTVSDIAREMGVGRTRIYSVMRQQGLEYQGTRFRNTRQRKSIRFITAHDVGFDTCMNEFDAF